MKKILCQMEVPNRKMFEFLGSGDLRRVHAWADGDDGVDPYDEENDPTGGDQGAEDGMYLNYVNLWVAWEVAADFLMSRSYLSHLLYLKTMHMRMVGRQKMPNVLMVVV